jgi:2-polyprenyl-6-methoxyphenol hydroxylase-like FAD-dependent oxidoreductase
MLPHVVIVGGGPAGMVLAYQLVTNGISVRVLEQHPDFEREFRGELLGPSVLPALDELGVLPILIERGLARTGVERRMFVGAKRRVTLPGGSELGAMISQPGMLALLHELSSQHPHYQMDFRASGHRAILEGERVVAIEARREGREERVEGDLFVVCSGRNSALRRDLGGDLELAEKPDNTLWIRVDLSDAPEMLPSGVDVHMFGEGVVLVLFATAGRPHLQIAYSAPGDLGKLRKDVPALHATVLPLLPEPLRAHVAGKLDKATKTQLLKVSIDRLKRWHVPGLLFLGDAAHTMSPAGAQGLNLAIRDSIVAANEIIGALKEKGAIDVEVLARIEAARRPEIEAAQAGQLRAHGMVHKPLFVQHLMFSILKLVMRVKKFTLPASDPVAPRFAVRATNPPQTG